MPITRTTLLSGPAAATFNGHTFFARDGILATPALELDEVESDANGWLDETVAEAPVTIRFTPSAPFADLIALYPWLEGAAGTALFGTSDVPLVLVAANGVRLTFAAAAIIEMPELKLSDRGTVAGTVTFLAIGARAQAVTAANRFVAIDIATPPTPPAGTPQLTDDFAITWSDSPWASLRSLEGITVKFAMKTRPVWSDANALLDVTLEKLAVEARFTPASPGGPAESDLVAALQLQGANALPGRSLAATASTLDIAGEHLWVRLPQAQLVRGEMAFDATQPRIGELVFMAERAWMNSGAEALALLTEGMP
ncbi:MAG: hypothetical protein LV479_09000 [Methylacidiphilales bacterium]|nr:hypothetical protein [Candidatus Methylacidiphilales bacterium]